MGKENKLRFLCMTKPFTILLDVLCLWIDLGVSFPHPDCWCVYIYLCECSVNADAENPQGFGVPCAHVNVKQIIRRPAGAQSDS